MDNIINTLSNGTALITVSILIAIGAILYKLFAELIKLIKNIIEDQKIRQAKEKHKKNLYEMKNLAHLMAQKLSNTPIPLEDIIRKEMSLDEIDEFMDIYTELNSRIIDIHGKIASHARTTQQKLAAAPKANNSSNNSKPNKNQNNNQNNPQNNQNNKNEGKKNDQPKKDNLTKFIANQAKKALEIEDQQKAEEIADKIKTEMKNKNLDLSNEQNAITSLKEGCEQTENKDLITYIQENYKD